jgi:hypothetical protein
MKLRKSALQEARKLDAAPSHDRVSVIVLALVDQIEPIRRAGRRHDRHHLPRRSL